MPLSNELSLRPTQSSQGDPVRSLDLTAFDLRLDRFRLVQPKAEQLMRRSLAKYGQLAPVVFCELEGSLVLVDGFKRLRAARTLQGMNLLRAHFIEIESLKGTQLNSRRLSSFADLP